MKSFHMVAGLPRAGSTLLCQILSSNPDFHVTPTSGVLDMLKIMRSTFSQNPTWRAQNRMDIYQNFKMGLQGFLDGYFHDAKVVFDKNRAWTGNLKLLDAITEDQTSKIIWLYRDPVEIVSSIEAQHQKTILLENMDEASAPGAFLTLDRRIGTYCNPDGIISQPVELLKDALEMGYGKRIFIVKYFDLANNTQEVMDAIHDFVGQPRHTYDIANVKQKTWEFDGIYNYKFLHTIRAGEIKWKTWKQGDFQLEPKFQAAINERFAPLNNFVIHGDASGLLNIPKGNDVPEGKGNDVPGGHVTNQEAPLPFLTPGLINNPPPPPDMPKN